MQCLAEMYFCCKIPNPLLKVMTFLGIWYAGFLKNVVTILSISAKNLVSFFFKSSYDINFV